MGRFVTVSSRPKLCTLFCMMFDFSKTVSVLALNSGCCFPLTTHFLGLGWGGVGWGGVVVIKL